MQLIPVSTASLEEHIDADNSWVQCSYSQSQFAVTLSTYQSQEKNRLERYRPTENEKIKVASKTQLSVLVLMSYPILNTIYLTLHLHILYLCTELEMLANLRMGLVCRAPKITKINLWSCKLDAE